MDRSKFAQLDFIDGTHHKHWKPLDEGTVVLTSNQAAMLWALILAYFPNGTDNLPDDIVEALRGGIDG